MRLCGVRRKSTVSVYIGIGYNGLEFAKNQNQNQNQIVIKFYVNNPNSSYFAKNANANTTYTTTIVWIPLWKASPMETGIDCPVCKNDENEIVKPGAQEGENALSGQQE